MLIGTEQGKGRLEMAHYAKVVNGEYSNRDKKDIGCYIIYSLKRD